MKFIKKRYIALLTLLSSVSLVGTGFSSWMIANISSAESEINISVSDVIDLTPYISAPTINYFEVCPLGLVVDETIIYKGDISISSSIQLKNGLDKTSFEFSNSISFFIKLTNTGSFNFFSSSYMGSNTPSVQYGFSSGSIDSLSTTTATINDNNIGINITYVDSNLSSIDILNLKIIYSFDFESFKDTFETDIYNSLGNNPLSFKMYIGARS